jgi:hypothetical protein
VLPVFGILFSEMEKAVAATDGGHRSLAYHFAVSFEVRGDRLAPRRIRKVNARGGLPFDDALG